MPSKKVCLIILDGWGIGEKKGKNAIATASTPTWDYLLKTYPHAALHASESYVGLPEGQMGNSEVGHMTIGSGRVIDQDLGRIDKYIKEEGFSKHEDLLEMCLALQKTGKSVHLMGLASSGGVHGHSDHLIALCDVFNYFSIKTYLHLFLDGRDVGPKSAFEEVDGIEKQLPKMATIATITGRYYAMDRDTRWERVEKAYLVIADAKGAIASSPLSYIQESYENNITDEFILPASMCDYKGMQDGDALVCWNFRADRSRQLLESFVDKDFKGFKRGRCLDFSFVYGMKSYSDDLDRYVGSLFKSERVENTLGEIIAKKNGKQLRLAETEKYAHVTFFFNGGSNVPFQGEDRILVPSPKVKTYDLQPGMSAKEVTDALLEAFEKGGYDLIVVNYANADMVGHTGSFRATCEAIEAVDESLKRIYDGAKKSKVDLIITADHGNAEKMLDGQTGEMHTAHTCNLVPFIFVPWDKRKSRLKKEGSLADIAPTVLDCLNFSKPKEMSGDSLLEVD